jgi:nitroreductase
MRLSHGENQYHADRRQLPPRSLNFITSGGTEVTAMNRNAPAALALVAVWLAAPITLPAAQEPLKLPPPRMDGGKPLMLALKERQSVREYSEQKLAPQTLSNLLWAAFGVNRADGRRTAPSASNRQEIDIYVVLPEGAYVYDAKANVLTGVASGDLRAAAGTQAYVATAAANLVYVADLSKAGRPATDPQQQLNVGADAGAIAENVYLFCASEGLATVVRASVDKPALAKRLQLRSDQQIVLAQSVGYPKK